jgi:3-dehydroquinate synthetase
MIVQDKKVKRGKLTFILVRAIGRPSSKQHQSRRSARFPQDLSE